MINNPENIQYLEICLQLQKISIPTEILKQIVDTIILIEKKKGKTSIDDCSNLAIKYELEKNVKKAFASKEEPKNESVPTETTSYEIYWDDLTNEAKKRLVELYHENIDLSPIAIIDIENEQE